MLKSDARAFLIPVQLSAEEAECIRFQELEALSPRSTSSRMLSTLFLSKSDLTLTKGNKPEKLKGHSILSALIHSIDLLSDYAVLKFVECLLRNLSDIRIGIGESELLNILFAMLCVDISCCGSCCCSDHRRRIS